MKKKSLPPAAPPPLPPTPYALVPAPFTLRGVSSCNDLSFSASLDTGKCLVEENEYVQRVVCGCSNLDPAGDRGVSYLVVPRAYPPTLCCWRCCRGRYYCRR